MAAPVLLSLDAFMSLGLCIVALLAGLLEGLLADLLAGTGTGPGIEKMSWVPGSSIC